MKLPTKPIKLTNVFVAFFPFLLLFFLPACAGSNEGSTPGTGGSKGTGGVTTPGSGGAPASSGGAPGSGGAVGTGGDVAGTGGSAPGTGGDNGSADTGGASSGGRGGAAQGSGGLGGTVQGGRSGTGTGGAGGSGTGPIGGVPHVTVQNATSIPAMFGTAIANPGTWTGKMYPAYYYNANGSVADIYKPPVKQSMAMMKPVNIYTPPGYDPQTQYPYIVVLHGFGNNEDRFYELAQPKLVPLFDNLITMKATKPFIAVFPNGTVGGQSNAAGYYNFGGELMNDLIPFIEANYSVKKDRGSRALTGFSFGGMQTILIGLCAHLKDFAWFSGLDPAGGSFPATEIASRVAMQSPEMYPLYYFHISVGSSDTTAGSSAASAANGLATKGPYITSANFNFQNNIPGAHTYPTAEVGLYNFLRMAFAPTN